METKYCKRCDQTLPIDRFTKSVGRYDGLQVYCAECMKLYRREHYHANKKAYKDRARENNPKYIAKTRAWVAEYKDKTGCQACGVKYPGEPWLLEFDHKDGVDKINTISALCQWGLSTVQKEIEKCQLLCVICHRRRTAKQLGWDAVDKPTAR